MQRLFLPGIQLIVQRLGPIGRHFAQSLLLLAFFCALSQIVYTATDVLSRPQAGLRNSNGGRRLSASQMQKAPESLRHKTGFLEMRFDESGFLTLGDRTRFVGASASARELLIATVDGRVAIELEAHDYSPHIAFRLYCRYANSRQQLCPYWRCHSERDCFQLQKLAWRSSEHRHFASDCRTSVQAAG